MPTCKRCYEVYEGEPRICQRCGALPGAPAVHPLNQLALTLARAIAVLGCVGSVISFFGALILFLGSSFKSEYGITALASFLGFIHFWALYVVFSRVQRI